MCHVESITLLWHEKQGYKVNHVLTTPALLFLAFSISFLPMKRRGVKFPQGAPPNIGSLRPIVAQQTARYDVASK